jgi:hypothetical protein
MDHMCFALPILPGKTEDVRAFQRELNGFRKREYMASRQRVGIVRERWFLQETAGGDVLLVSMESPDSASALRRLAVSQDAFDGWFKRQLAGTTGADLDDPGATPFSELLFSVEGTGQVREMKAGVLHV